MYPPLRFRFRDTLNSMSARFKLEMTVDVLSHYAADNFLEAAVLSRSLRQDLNAPALLLGIAVVHPIQVTGKNSGFITTGPRPYL